MNKLILSFLVVFLVAFLGSLVTNADTEWYDSIKPSITPPDYVFPIVWTILFVLIAISFYFSLIKDGSKVWLFYGLNFIFNFLWSLFFFGFKNVSLAFIDLILLWISIIWLVVFSYRLDKRASYLLVPYFLWVSFAGALNFLML